MSKSKPKRSRSRSLLLLLPLCFFLLWSSPAFASGVLIDHTFAQSSDTKIVTTGARTTTGAPTLIMAYSYLGTGGTPTPSDSKSNSWTVLTASCKSMSVCINIAYVCNATVGTNHTFTVDGGASVTYPTIAVQAWSGGKFVACNDSQSAGGTGASITTLATGSLTPSEANEIVVAAISLGQVAAYNCSPSSSCVNSGLTVSDAVENNVTTAEGIIMAYIVQTSAGAVNATFTWTNSIAGAAATEADFKAAPIRSSSRAMGVLP